MLREQLRSILDKAFEKLSHNLLSETVDCDVFWDVPQNPDHGDFSTNLAMLSAKFFKKSPVFIAKLLVEEMKKDPFVLEFVDDLDVVNPGFINIRLSVKVYWGEVYKVLSQKLDYGRSSRGEGKTVRIEFVSANPTGPLHIGHGRGAVIGDVLATVFEFAGYKVLREYYLNDCGRQIGILGKTAKSWKSAILLKTEPSFDENSDGEWYRGSYMKDVAQNIDLSLDEDDFLWGQRAGEIILDRIKDDLRNFSVKDFDLWSSEKSLRDSGHVQKTLDFLKDKGFVFKHDGALWFRSSQWGDSKDRVLVKKDGELTYLASDIAFHREKFEDSDGRCVNIWGADHHGYVDRIRGAVKALGHDPQNLSVILCQIVRLMRSGTVLPMSTRSGNFISLKDVLDEMGPDAVRYFFLMHKTGTHLDFDLDKIKEKSIDNPVYYIQYAYARICGIVKKVSKKNISVSTEEEEEILFEELDTDIELSLARKMTALPSAIENVIASMEPYYLTVYLRSLASDFHSFYRQCRVVSDNLKKTRARLALVKAIQVVFENVLSLMGISSPEFM